MTQPQAPTFHYGLSVPGEGVVSIGRTARAVVVRVELSAGARATVYVPLETAVTLAEQIHQTAVQRPLSRRGMK